MSIDYFTKEEVYDIVDAGNASIGTDTVTYKILKVRNTKNLTDSNTYSVSVRHRIVIAGSDWKSGGDYQNSGFTNYPILVTVQSGIKAASDPKAKITLKKVFPKTINATVEQSSNLSTGSSNTQSKQTSSGSSSSNVNTFGINLSAGFFGVTPTGSIGADYSHSWEHTTSESNDAGSGTSEDAQATSGNEMSVKDWSACSSTQNIDGTSDSFQGEFIQWNWGQSYPWDIFKYSETASGPNIRLPENVAASLLYSSAPTDGTASQNILLPPSDLSLFGLDFTMVAEWHVTFPTPLALIETLQFQHTVNVIQASHSMVAPSTAGGKASVVATLNAGNLNTFTQDVPMDLGQYALAPLAGDLRNAVGIGFQSNLFDLPPVNASTEFKIRSRSNNVLVTGVGFGSVMSANFPSGYSGPGATLKIAFKVADVRIEYALLLKHWKGPKSGNILLKCAVNDNQTLLTVVDVEGQGSANNLAQLDLRNFDLKSPNFHDYLVPGWNEIVVTILPADATVASEYLISALSLEG